MSQTIVAMFVVALFGGQAAGPEIVNKRLTYGQLGAPRPMTGMLPGDVAHFSFEIKNLKADAKGRVAYSIAIVVTDEKGKVFFEQKPYSSIATIFFGGDALPAAARVDVPLGTQPGIMNWKVTVVDRTTGKSKELKGQGKVLPADFGLVQVGTFADAETKAAIPPAGVVGSQLYVSFGVVGFERSKEKQPDIKVSLSIRDDKGQLTTPPLTGEVRKDVPADVRVVPMTYGLTLDRAGRFTIELTAHDEISGKTSTVHFPVRILPSE
jgi:hypothetical protein